MSTPACLRHLLRVLLLCALCAAAAVRAGPAEEKAQTIIHMLDYVAVDYPEFVQDGKVLDAAEYEEQREFARQSLALLEQLPEAADKPALLAQARELSARIDAKASGSEVAGAARALGAGLVRAYGVAVAPRQAPDLARARTLFATQCAACHGAQGRGDGPVGQGLDPAPSNFHDDARMRQRSLYGLYNTITLGVGGTGMKGYTGLSEDERWALAFLAAGMRTPPDQVGRGEALWNQGTGRKEIGDFRALVARIPAAIAQRGSELDAVRAFLTAQPQALAAVRPSPLQFTRAKLQQALAAYRAGDRGAARQAAITAYLEGFELVESALDNVDEPLRREVEEAMMALRSDIDAASPAEAVGQRIAQLDALLDRAGERLAAGEMSPATAFTASLLILLREGLEAILVLAAIIAFVRKTGRRDAMPWIHAGWIGAMALGVATWFAARNLIAISGANREVTEGVTALLAAAMLLYVGLWLHRRSSAHAWNAFIREQVTSALERRTLWAMAAVSFLAVYREFFEVILFYETLFAQAGERRGDAVLGGMGAAVVLLALLGWAILKYSVRLPLSLFFRATSALLVVLAIVFVGHGIAALQEAGWLAATPAPFVELPLLGVHANVQGLLAQVAVIALVAGAVAWGRRRQLGTS